MTRGGADLKTWWGFMVFRGVFGGAVQRRATLFRKCCTAVLEWTPFSRRENGRVAAPAPAGAASRAFTCPPTSPRRAAGRAHDTAIHFIAPTLQGPLCRPETCHRCDTHVILPAPQARPWIPPAP